MGMIDNLFSSDEAISKNALLLEEEILRSLNDYQKRLCEKEQLINMLPYQFGQRKASIQKLQQLLVLEFIDIQKGEQKEKDVISSIRALEHSKKIKYVEQLERALAYAETRHQYVYELLCAVYTALKSEADLLKQLMLTSDLKKYRKLVARLKSELAFEKAIAEKISSVKTFHKLFTNLIKGEHILRAIDSKEKRLVGKMREGSPIGGITDKWVALVFRAIGYKIHQAVAAETLDQHENADFEFVNSPAFIKFAENALASFRKGEKRASPQLINALVTLFRQKYNQID